MKVAVIGSRSISALDLSCHLPSEITEIVSGGARGVDEIAVNYANARGLRLTVFYPDYKKYGRAAPLRRNDEIIRYADAVYAFWDGTSKGTAYVIRQCRRQGKPLQLFIVQHV